MATKADIDRYLENWQDEVESSFLYGALAKAEKQPALALVYRKLALTHILHHRLVAKIKAQKADDFVGWAMPTSPY